MSSVDQILKDIGAHEKPELVIFNKLDAFQKSFGVEEADRVDEIQKEINEALKGNCVFISATEKSNFDFLKKTVYKMAAEIHSIRYPFNSFLY